MPQTYAALPTPPHNVSLRLTSAAAKRVRKGQPFVYASDVTHQNRDGEPGALAAIFDDKRNFVAVGFYEPDGPIKARVLARGKPQKVDEAFIGQRLDAAAAIREGLPPDTTGFRLVHGEGDGLSGLIIDRYDTTFVIKVYATAWLTHLDTVLEWLKSGRAGCRPTRIVLRSSRLLHPLLSRCGLHDGSTLYGEAPADDDDERTWFTENGLQFCADVVRGQKTGFFLDQRENRRRVGELADGRSVLNVFSYNGGFSLYAAAAGAHRVISLDQNKHALADAQHIFQANGPRVAACNHVTLCGDAFMEMNRLVREGDMFDVVVIDPPSFAKRAGEVEQAKTAYSRLANLGAQLTVRGGTLVFASCSSRVDLDMLTLCATQGAKSAGRPIVVDDSALHAIDHPIAHPSLTYLKCLYATVT